MNNDTLISMVNDLKDYTKNHRQYLHCNPELSGEEFETSKYLKEEIRKIGLEINDVQGTGFYAILDTGKKGKTLGIRADIDALPIEESEYNLKEKRKFISKNSGVMHACGHDAHMAMLLTTAKILNNIKDELQGKIVFIFEEGEEKLDGYKYMIEGIKHLNFDAIYGSHISSSIDVGKVGIESGAVMAGAIELQTTVKGKGGHGSRPDLSISPIFAAANIIVGLSTAWVNQIDVTKTVTLSLGSIHGGNASNVIPDTVHFSGSVRYFDKEEGEKALNIYKNTCSLIAKANNCEVDFTNDTQIKTYPVINDEKLADIAKKAIIDIMPESLITGTTWFASETFCFYSNLCPCLFTFVGAKNLEKGYGAEHHNKHFDIDEDSLYYGVLAEVKFAYDFLNGSN